MKSAILVCAFVFVPIISFCEDCTPGGNNYVTTDHFFFAASSDQGAVGDVVAVDISLTLEDTNLTLEGLALNLSNFTLVGCYDSNSLEVIGSPRYSEFFNQFAEFTLYYPEGGEPERLRNDPGGGFLLNGLFRPGAVERFLSSGRAFPLITVYFRITGDPETETEIRFCDEKIVGRSCASNNLSYSHPTRRFFQTWSTRHLSGTIRILPGKPTRPDPPSLPPNAKVYPEAPTPETADIRFELEGPLVASPGDTVSMGLFATSNYEFSGFMTALTFPAEYLQLTNVEEHTRPGVVAVDNDLGEVGLFMSNSRRRVGEEGERVHFATLRFSVSEETQDAGQVSIRFEPFGNFFNWIAIHHREGVNTHELPITAEVTPLLLTDTVLEIQVQPARIGDVNLDYEVNLTDAVNLLGTLFLGEKSVVCPEAADYNEDGRVDVSDPIAILNWLFRGGHEASEQEIFCGTGSL